MLCCYQIYIYCLVFQFAPVVLKFESSGQPVLMRLMPGFCQTFSQKPPCGKASRVVVIPGASVDEDEDEEDESVSTLATTELRRISMASQHHVGDLSIIIEQSSYMDSDSSIAESG